jgi:hypothetical protein
MKKIALLLATGVMLVGFTARVLAADDAKKEVTLTGTVVCAKCKLHEAGVTKCQNVLQVEKDGKTVNYYMNDNKVSKDFHKDICENDGEKATVTGKVSEKDGKQMMVASKIEPAK